MLYIEYMNVYYCVWMVGTWNCVRMFTYSKMMALYGVYYYIHISWWQSDVFAQHWCICSQIIYIICKLDAYIMGIFLYLSSPYVKQSCIADFFVRNGAWTQDGKSRFWTVKNRFFWRQNVLSEKRVSTID